VSQEVLRQKATVAEDQGRIEEILGDWRAWLADRLAEERSEFPEGSKRELAERLIRQRLDELARKAIVAGDESFSKQEELELETRLLDEMFGLGRLQRFIEDPEVENIDVNGAHCAWVTRSGGRKEMVGSIAASDDELVQLIRSAASRFGLSERRFDQGCPELDMRLPDGSRLSALMAVCASPAVSIRRHRYTDVGLGDLVDLGMMDEHLASFLAAAVRARKNIIVSGGMNVGKTTLLRALAAEIPPAERIVTIEQAMELGLDAIASLHPDIVALEAREPNSEGEGGFTMAMLVRRALRMNADRVIVGEVLGGEVIVMLNAMSQGRSGSMCTIHSDSSLGVFRRIASYAAQATERLPVEATNLLIAGSIHFVVHLDLVPGEAANGAERVRSVVSVREVVDAEGLQIISNEVFRPGPRGRAIPGAPIRSKTLEDLIEFGYWPLEEGKAALGAPCARRRLDQSGLESSGGPTGGLQENLDDSEDRWDEALEEIFEPLEGSKRNASFGSLFKKAFGHDSLEPEEAATGGQDDAVSRRPEEAATDGQDDAVSRRPEEAATGGQDDAVSRRLAELLGPLDPYLKDAGSMEAGLSGEAVSRGTSGDSAVSALDGAPEHTPVSLDAQEVRYSRGWR